MGFRGLIQQKSSYPEMQPPQMHQSPGESLNWNKKSGLTVFEIERFIQAYVGMIFEHHRFHTIQTSALAHMSARHLGKEKSEGCPGLTLRVKYSKREQGLVTEIFLVAPSRVN
ncbi:hypothetical protein QAD02_022719 [Eretmocerus hayati]|uniref:Uncharacterized protein n=1 Tax=Eretmocerus hayati TaxID=131215 RepID=A0ACC2PYP5_9HYME|nr:hypothetical protein QAD02_022719 [Eretmocerus hayati]